MIKFGKFSDENNNNTTLVRAKLLLSLRCFPSCSLISLALLRFPFLRFRFGVFLAFELISEQSICTPVVLMIPESG